MSARNGDKARFGKQRKRKMAHRARTRDLRESLVPGAPSGAEAVPTAQAPVEKKPEQDTTAPATRTETHSSESHGHEHAGALGSAAGAIGSVLGTLAAKVRGVKEPEPAHAD